MKNTALNKELTQIISNPNLISINKGGVSGASIEVNYETPPTFDSFVYYSKTKERDADYEELIKLVGKNKV
jgi:hypothetical protein